MPVYGSVPHQLIWRALGTHHVPKPVIQILQNYFHGFEMRFTTKSFTTRRVQLEVGIAMGCAISPALFVLAIQVILNAVEPCIPEAHVGGGLHMPPIKAFMDDTTLITNRKQVMQRAINKANDLLGWCRMEFKPAKSRSLALTRGKLRENVFFFVADQRIPTVSEEHVKSLGRIFDTDLSDKKQEEAIKRQCKEGMDAIDRAPLPGKYKVWISQFVLLPRLLWPLTIYEIGLPFVESLEKSISRRIRVWLGLPPGLSSIALYSKSARLRLPLSSIAEEYKVGKIRTQLMISNSADPNIREINPQIRSGRKLKAQEEIRKSEETLKFEEIRGQIQHDRHSVGWNHFTRWSKASAPVRASLVVQERRREIESDRISKAVQQAQQGQWTTWEDVVQRSWHEMWNMSPLRLAFVVRSIYDVLPSRVNLQRWGITQDAKCTLCGESQTLRHVLSGCSYALAHGRFTWRHNQVLLVAIEAIKAACSSANAQESVPQRKAYFLREGASQFARSRCRAKRRHILENANDWKIAADVEGLRHYPQVLAESGKRPDVVLSSTKADTFVLAELTVPWEDRIGQSNTLKEDRYMELTLDFQQKNYKVWFFAFEVGARGMVGQSTYTFLREIGLTSKVRSKALADMSRAAEAASQWIWSKRDCK